VSEYETFMIYELDDSGERVRLDISVESEVEEILHPEQVVVIVKEDIRRIFIWKGAKSTVRKRFISSRVAQGLQEELVKGAAFHRCKIVSVDQGSEPVEFLNVFGLESMPVTEKLADMRYIRNIDRQKMMDQGIVPEEGPKVVKVDTEKEKPEEYYSPALEELDTGADNKGVVSIPSPKNKTPIKSRPYVSPSKRAYPSSRVKVGTSESEKKKIMKKILDTEVPNTHKRLNLILGHTLYGAVSKKVKVLGKTVEETDWEPVKKIPKDMIQLEEHIIRAYLDQDKGIVEAIEILEKEDTEEIPPEKNSSPKKSPEKKPSAKKSNSSSSTRRKLPSVPKE